MLDAITDSDDGSSCRRSQPRQSPSGVARARLNWSRVYRRTPEAVSDVHRSHNNPLQRITAMIRDHLLSAMAILATAALLSVTLTREAQTSPMPVVVQAALCGTVDDPTQTPPEPWGHKCDNSRACNACFFSGANCYACDATTSYKTCGTPADELCNNSSFTVKCGDSKKYQAAGSAGECETCVGSGSNTGKCTKNSCAAS